VHGLTINDMVEIAGNATTSFNGKYQILTVPTTTTFTVLLNPSSAAPGAGGTARLTFDLCLDNVSVASGQAVTQNTFTMVEP
jgi:hypothetical protein